MIAALLVGLLLPQDARLAPAQVRLRGPLTRARLELGARGGATLTGSLLPGEERALLVPLPGRPLDDAAPEVGVEPAAGAAVFEGWSDRPDPAWPVELRRRGLPPVDAGEPRPSPAAVALLLAAGALVLATRRRPAAAALAGLGGAAAVAALQLGAPAPPAERVRVLEGAEDRWLLVEGAADRLPVDPATDRLVAEPPRASLRFEGELASAGRPAGGPAGATWTAALPGGRLWRRAPLDPGARRLDGAINLWGDLAAAWTRGADGAWSSRGAWPLGEPLPAGAPGAPPGWLAAGLPQGRGVLVARLAPGTWSGPEGPGGVPGRVWLRRVGVEFTGGR